MYVHISTCFENIIIRAIPSVTSCEIEREKFYPGMGIEPGPLALRANMLPLRYPGQLPIQGRISQLANRGHCSDNYIFNITSLIGRKHEISFHYWSFKYMNACPGRNNYRVCSPEVRKDWLREINSTLDLQLSG